MTPLFRLHRAGDHTTARCRCGYEVTYREPEPPTARNARRAHDCDQETNR